MSSSRPSSEATRSSRLDNVQPLLVDLQLEAVHALGESGEALAQGRLLPAQLGELGRHRGARGLGRRELDPRLADRAVDRVEHGAAAAPRPRRRPRAAPGGSPRAARPPPPPRARARAGVRAATTRASPARTRSLSVSTSSRARISPSRAASSAASMPSRADASRIGRGASRARVSWSSARARRRLGLLDGRLTPGRAPRRGARTPRSPPRAGRSRG